ncbi:MAG: HAMP domain-containing histidine kinase, partial [Methylobacteriaceae bacterium]|nr:HAMP domain-containing histidine kinase [Methylobacteriaceae bacterium]
KHSFSPEPVDFAGLLRVVIEATAPAARYVHSPISVDAPESIAGVCDRLAFEQIAENLITNAIKYGAGQPVHIRLSLVGGMVRLTVRDEGPGISEADRRRIFERFERVIAHSHLAGGFGIGLWVVRQLVEAMGGRIELQSELARGSKFTVELPVEATRTKQLEEGEAP